MKPTKKSKKKTKNFYSEEFELYEGKVRVFRVKSRSGDIWQFRCWLDKEKKYCHRSLKTTDKKVATRNAKKLYEELKPTIKKPPRVKFHTDEFEVYDGDIIVYRTNHSGKVWQFRTWIKEENRYFRKSLFTKDSELARERAIKLFREINAKIDNKEMVFDKTVRELCDEYLKEQKKRIRTGSTAKGRGNIGITQGRFTTLRTQVEKHFLGFVGEKLGELRYPPYTMNRLSLLRFATRKRKFPGFGQLLGYLLTFGLGVMAAMINRMITN